MTRSRGVQQGFTLLEVMIVILILAVAAATVQLTAPARDPLELANERAQALRYWFSRQQDQVLISGREVGLYFLSDKVLRLGWRAGEAEDGEPEIVWQVEDELMLAQADDVHLELQLDLQSLLWQALDAEMPDDLYLLTPQIILLPSEEYLPSFQLSIQDPDERSSEIVIRGDGFNRLEVRRASR